MIELILYRDGPLRLKSYETDKDGFPKRLGVMMEPNDWKEGTPHWTCDEDLYAAVRAKGGAKVLEFANAAALLANKPTVAYLTPEQFQATWKGD